MEFAEIQMNMFSFSAIITLGVLIFAIDLFRKIGFCASLSGSIKGMMGYIVLSFSGTLTEYALSYLGNTIYTLTGINLVVPNNEASISLLINTYGTYTISVFLLSMCYNVALARFTRLKYAFLSGHHIIYMSLLVVLLLSSFGISGINLILNGGLLVGLLMTVMPTLIQPAMTMATSDDTFSMGHFGTCGYLFACAIGKMCSRFKKCSTSGSSESTNVALFRESSLIVVIEIFALSISMFGFKSLCSLISGSIDLNTSVILPFTNSVLISLICSAGIYLSMSGVRLIIADILPFFESVFKQIVPSAIPALDCPVLFPFSQNAMMLGFTFSYLGGWSVLLVLSLFNLQGYSIPLVVPTIMFHYFCGATAGILGNAYGGSVGCKVASYLHGMISTLGTVLFYLLWKPLSYTIFSDIDFAVVGIIFRLLVEVFPDINICIWIISINLVFIVVFFDKNALHSFKA